MMENFKWYRKRKGGTWYRNRYIYDFGRTVIFLWEREKKNNGWSGYTVEIENYENKSELVKLLKQLNIE